MPCSLHVIRPLLCWAVSPVVSCLRLARCARPPVPFAGQPCIISKDVIEDAVGSVALALSVVMAGSGHLPTFKLLRGAPGGWATGLGADAVHS